MNLPEPLFVIKLVKVASHHSALEELHWPPTPATAELVDDEVHVICVTLNVSPDRLAQLKATLSSDEQDRAAKYRFQDGKDFFVAGRGLLREVLGHYQGMPAEQIEFRYNQSGKPELAGAAANRELRFNVAHSGADAVFALTLHADIGVDLERIRDVPDMLQIVSYALSDAEKREWDGLEEAERRRAFFDCWARKEAFLKGIGEGLQRQPSEIEVPLRRSRPEESLSIGGQGCKVDGWSLRSLSAGDYAVAVAIKGQPTRVSCWAWQPQETLTPAR